MGDIKIMHATNAISIGMIIDSAYRIPSVNTKVHSINIYMWRRLVDSRHDNGNMYFH